VKSKFVIPVICTVAAIAFAVPADARPGGCVKGAIVGGIAGHFIGHGGWVRPLDAHTAYTGETNTIETIYAMAALAMRRGGRATNTRIL
jgi:uncharacterized protein YcfJ